MDDGGTSACLHTFVAYHRVSLRQAYCILCSERIGRVVQACKCLECEVNVHAHCGKKYTHDMAVVGVLPVTTHKAATADGSGTVATRNISAEVAVVRAVAKATTDDVVARAVRRVARSTARRASIVAARAGAGAGSDAGAGAGAGASLAVTAACVHDYHTARNMWLSRASCHLCDGSIGRLEREVRCSRCDCHAHARCTVETSQHGRLVIVGNVGVSHEEAVEARAAAAAFASAVKAEEAAAKERELKAGDVEAPTAAVPAVAAHEEDIGTSSNVSHEPPAVSHTRMVALSIAGQAITRGALLAAARRYAATPGTRATAAPAPSSHTTRSAAGAGAASVAELQARHTAHAARVQAARAGADASAARSQVDVLKGLLEEQARRASAAHDAQAASHRSKLALQLAAQREQRERVVVQRRAAVRAAAASAASLIASRAVTTALLRASRALQRRRGAAPTLRSMTRPESAYVLSSSHSPVAPPHHALGRPSSLATVPAGVPLSPTVQPGEGLGTAPDAARSAGEDVLRALDRDDVWLSPGDRAALVTASSEVDLGSVQVWEAGQRPVAGRKRPKQTWQKRRLAARSGTLFLYKKAFFGKEKLVQTMALGGATVETLAPQLAGRKHVLCITMQQPVEHVVWLAFASAQAAVEATATVQHNAAFTQLQHRVGTLHDGDVPKAGAASTPTAASTPAAASTPVAAAAPPPPPPPRRQSAPMVETALDAHADGGQGSEEDSGEEDSEEEGFFAEDGTMAPETCTKCGASFQGQLVDHVCDTPPPPTVRSDGGGSGSGSGGDGDGSGSRGGHRPDQSAPPLTGEQAAQASPSAAGGDGDDTSKAVFSSVLSRMREQLTRSRSRRGSLDDRSASPPTQRRSSTPGRAAAADASDGAAGRSEAAAARQRSSSLLGARGGQPTVRSRRTSHARISSFSAAPAPDSDDSDDDARPSRVGVARQSPVPNAGSPKEERVSRAQYLWARLRSASREPSSLQHSGGTGSSSGAGAAGASASPARVVSRRSTPSSGTPSSPSAPARGRSSSSSSSGHGFGGPADDEDEDDEDEDDGVIRIGLSDDSDEDDASDNGSGSDGRGERGDNTAAPATPPRLDVSLTRHRSRRSSMSRFSSPRMDPVDGGLHIPRHFEDLGGDGSSSGEENEAGGAYDSDSSDGVLLVGSSSSDDE